MKTIRAIWQKCVTIRKLRNQLARLERIQTAFERDRTRCKQETCVSIIESKHLVAHALLEAGGTLPSTNDYEVRYYCPICGYSHTKFDKLVKHRLAKHGNKQDNK